MGPDKDNTVLKKIKNDPQNPFGALIKDGINDPEIGTKKGGQSYYIDDDGNKKLSLINKKNDEGDWMDWSVSCKTKFVSY